MRARVLHAFSILASAACFASCDALKQGSRSPEIATPRVEFPADGIAVVHWEDTSVNPPEVVIKDARGDSVATPESIGGPEFRVVTDLEPGAYTVEVTPSRGQPKSATFEVAEATALPGLLYPRRSDFEQLSHDADLSVLLAIPSWGGADAASQPIAEVRDEFTQVARSLTEVFVGPTYPVHDNAEVEGIVSNRRALLADRGNGTPSLYQANAARALIVADIRLPTRDGPEPQLAVALYDLVEPDPGGEVTRNQRWKLFEAYEEIPSFEITSDDQTAILLRAMAKCLDQMVADPVVRAYWAVVTEQPAVATFSDAATHEKLRKLTGSTVPPRGEGQLDNYAYTEATILFPDWPAAASAAGEPLGDEGRDHEAPPSADDEEPPGTGATGRRD